jgi:hypothetical protein
MLTIGKTVSSGTPVELSIDDRRQGTYVIGTTGTGKSTLLKNIIVQDMQNEEKYGVCVIDPHGDLIDEVLGLVPKDRIDDVVLLDPMETEFPFGLNLLECDNKDPHQVRWVVSTVMGTLERLFIDSWGPRLEHVLRHTLLTALTLDDATFIELSLLLTKDSFREKVAAGLTDPLLQQFWKDIPRGFTQRFDFLSSTINKISPFITDRTMRNIIGQPKNHVDLYQVMNEGKILLINLSKGDLGEANSSLLGAVIVNLVLIAALQRRSIPADQRKPFHLVVDEFQNFATESFSILQSEARKYAVDVLVAHQYRDQLDLNSKGSTLNVGNMIGFRVNGRDSYDLASQFDNAPPPPDSRVEPIYQEYDFQGMEVLLEAGLNTGEGKLFQEVELPRRPYNDVEAEMANKLSVLPNFEARCRLINYPKDSSRPKLIEKHIVTELLRDKDGNVLKPDPAIAKAIREKYRKNATPRKEVEKEIERRSLGEISSEEDIPQTAEKRKQK